MTPPPETQIAEGYSGSVPGTAGRGGREYASRAYDQSFLRNRDRDVLRRSRPADFHARHAEGSAKVRIDTLEVIESGLGRRQLRFVLAWAELHQDELSENWRRARAGETLRSVEPLR
jgi:hypothetical protein